MCCCYDRLMSPLEKLFFQRRRNELCAQLVGRGVDLGAGTGINFPLFRRSGEPLTVVALEPDEVMRSRASQRLAGLDQVSIEISKGRGEALPFEDSSLDWVLCTLVLCSVESPAQVLSEIRRVLKPSGKLYFLEHVRGQGWVGSMHDWLTPVWKRLVDNCHLNRDTLNVIRSSEAEANRCVDLQERFEILRLPFVWGWTKPQG
jgi:ubiquinone/menaquinone biosynthesis C-methylase UbiE